MLYWDKQYNYGILNDNRTIIRAHSLIHFISFGNFQIHNILFNLMSFAGSIALYKFFKGNFQIPKWILLAALFFVPSFLFWGSGVLKEAILIYGLGMLLYNLFLNEKQTKWIWVVFFVVLMIWIKTYVLIALIPGLVFVLLTDRLFKKLLINYSVVLLAMASLGMILNITGLFDLQEHLIQKQQDFFRLVEATTPNSMYFLPEINSFSDILLHAPHALFTCLFRPFIWEVNGALDALAALENVTFFALIVFVFIFRKINLKRNKWAIFNWSFVLILAVIIGLVTPVFGALVRYKIPLLPFFIVALFCMIDMEKMYKVFPFLKNLKNL